MDTGQLNEFELAVLKRSIVGTAARDLRARRGQRRTSGTGSRRLRCLRDRAVVDRRRTAVRLRPRPESASAVGLPRRRLAAHRDVPRGMAGRDAGLDGPHHRGAEGSATPTQIADVDRRLLDALAEARCGHRRTWPAGGRGGVLGPRFVDRRGWRRHPIALQEPARGPVLGRRPSTVEPNLTLVNLFPSLFEQLFGVDWVRRPDTQYRFGTRPPSSYRGRRPGRRGQPVDFRRCPPPA